MLKKRFERTLADQIPSTLLFTAIGVVAAKKLGIEIVLHTDDYGAKLFEDIPYDEVYLTLNGHNIHHQFWASGKMVALEKEPLGACHLDNDAWIKRNPCKHLILSATSDLVAQSIENSMNVYKSTTAFVFDNVDDKSFLDFNKIKHPFKAYNCGVVKINNQKLKDQYLDAYWRVTHQLDKSKPEGFEHKYCIPDLVAEQWVLYQLCDQFGYSGTALIAGNEQENAKKIGYTHLISEEKYRIDDKLKNILLELDSDLLSKIWKKAKEVV